MESESDGDSHREMSSKKRKTCFMGIVYILFSINLRVSHCDKYQEFLALSLPHLCPYSKFCTMGPFKEFKYKENSPCCKPCSCDHDCFIIGNCCSDLVTVHNHTTPTAAATAVCSSPVHYGYNGYEMHHTHDSRGYMFYYITATCPLGHRDIEVVKKCISPSRENLKDLVLVSDNRRRVYSNRYCAECHGVNVFRPWNIKLSCAHYPRNLTGVLPTVVEMHENRCLILSEPPMTDIVSAARCFPIDSDTCNTKEGVDPNMERACRSVMAPYVHVDFMHTTTYKNPYCYACSMDGEYDINTVCPLDVVESSRTGFTQYPFNAILDMNTIKRAQNKIANTNTNPCLPMEIFDYHFGKCRRLNCPVTMVPREGKCAQLFKSTASLSLRLGIGVNSIKASEESKQVFSKAMLDFLIFTAVMETIAFDSLRDTGIQKFSCGKCTSSVLAIKDNTSYVLDYGFQTNSKCQASDIINSLKKFSPERKYLSLDKEMLQSSIPVQLSYNVQTAFGHLSDLSHYSRELVGTMYTHASDCLYSVSLEPLFHCPCVDIQQSEYIQLLLANTTDIDIAHFTVVVKRNSTGDSIGNTYRICVDKYLDNKNTGRTHGANRMSECACIAMAVIVHFYVTV